MISGGQAKRAAVFGLGLVLSSVLLFMQCFPEQENLHWTSLFFIVLGEALPVSCAIWLEEHGGRQMHPGLRMGVYALFLVYGLSSVSLALILLLLSVSAGLLAVLEVVLGLAFGAVLLFAVSIAGSAEAARARTGEALAFMRGLEDEISALTRQPANRVYGKQLRRTAEALRYGDHSGLTGMDTALREKIRELRFVLEENKIHPMHVYSELSAESGRGPVGESTVEHIRRKQVDLLTEDILLLVESRNSALQNEKKARNYTNV